MWTCDEAAAPELYAVCLSAGVWLMACAVDGDEWQSVGYGVTSLYCNPCFALAFLFLGRVAAFVSDSGWVDEQLGSGECHEACTFGVPLIPAYLHAKESEAGLYGVESEISGGEVELFVVCGVVGDVHLAVFTGDGAVGLEDDGGVVAETWCTVFVKAGHEDDVMLGCKGRVELCGRTGYGFGEAAEVYVLCLTEVLAVVQFLKDYELCSVLCCRAYVCGEFLAVALDVCRAGLLDDSYFHSCGYCMVQQCRLPF